jgi:plasmid rolling circle replication initiator protein Rep
MQSYVANTIIVHNHYHAQLPNLEKENFEPVKPEIPLVDTIKGKPQPWRRKKSKSLSLAHAMREIGEHMHKKANRVYWCSDELHFTAEPTEGGKLMGAGFCRDRLCATCNWRKSIKTFYNLSRVLDVVQTENPNLETIFLTLTVKNCIGAELDKTLDEMFGAWKRLINHRSWTRSVVGYFRALEVTYNRVAETYHPHFHAILLVDKEYFKDPKKYLQHSDWLHLWKVSCRLDYDPSVRIQAVRTNMERKRAHIAEVAKYTVKDTDVIHKDPAVTVQVVEVLGTALHRRRLFAFGGIMYKVAKRLKMDKPEEGDLVNIAEDTMREDVAAVFVTYKWDFGISDYVRRDLI